MTIMRCATLIFSYLLGFFLFGCSTVVVPTAKELVKASQEDKIYLAHNLWATNSNLIPIENYPKGVIVSAGTEVELISYNENEIKFKSSTGNIYSILYKKERTMLSVEAYIPLLFILKNPLADIDSETCRLIRDGKVVRGMKKEVVLLSLGFPMRTRTPNMELNNTWTYWADINKYRKMVFKNGQLLEILE